MRSVNARADGLVKGMGADDAQIVRSWLYTRLTDTRDNTRFDTFSAMDDVNRYGVVPTSDFIKARQMVEEGESGLARMRKAVQEFKSVKPEGAIATRLWLRDRGKIWEGHGLDGLEEDKTLWRDTRRALTGFLTPVYNNDWLQTAELLWPDKVAAARAYARRGLVKMTGETAAKYIEPEIYRQYKDALHGTSAFLAEMTSEATVLGTLGDAEYALRSDAPAFDRSMAGLSAGVSVVPIGGVLKLLGKPLRKLAGKSLEKIAVKPVKALLGKMGKGARVAGEAAPPSVVGPGFASPGGADGSIGLLKAAKAGIMSNYDIIADAFDDKAVGGDIARLASRAYETYHTWTGEYMYRIGKAFEGIKPEDYTEIVNVMHMGAAPSSPRIAKAVSGIAEVMGDARRRAESAGVLRGTTPGAWRNKGPLDGKEAWVVGENKNWVKGVLRVSDADKLSLVRPNRVEEGLFGRQEVEIPAIGLEEGDTFFVGSVVPDERYVPLRLDRAKIAEDPDAAVDKIYEHFVKTGQMGNPATNEASERAREVVQRMVADIVNGQEVTAQTVADQLGRQTSKIRATRRWHFPVSVMQDDYLPGMLMQHIEHIVRDTEMTKVFGPLVSGLDHVEGVPAGPFGPGMSQAAFRGLAPDKAIQFRKAMSDAFGTAIKDSVYRAKATFAQASGAYQTAAHLSTLVTTTKQFAQAASAGAFFGYGRFIKESLAGVGEMAGRQMATIRKFIKWAGDEPEKFNEASRILRSGLIDQERQEMIDRGFRLSKVPGLLSKVGDRAASGSFLRPVDEALRVVAAKTGRSYVEDTVTRMAQDGVLAHKKRYDVLTSHALFRYTKEDVDRMVGEALQAGQQGRKFRLDGDDLSVAWGGGIRTQVRANPLESPSALTREPLMREIFRFRTFEYGQARLVTEAVRMSAKGNYGPLVRMGLGYMAAGKGQRVLEAAVRSFIHGDDKKWEKEAEDTKVLYDTSKAVFSGKGAPEDLARLTAMLGSYMIRGGMLGAYSSSVNEETARYGIEPPAWDTVMNTAMFGQGSGAYAAALIAGLFAADEEDDAAVTDAKGRQAKARTMMNAALRRELGWYKVIDDRIKKGGRLPWDRLPERPAVAPWPEGGLEPTMPDDGPGSFMPEGGLEPTMPDDQL